LNSDVSSSTSGSRPKERGAWKGYREKHGQYATPTQVQFDADSGDLRIGTDPLSSAELIADVGSVESELIKIMAET
jgi:hypothetical protein